MNHQLIEDHMMLFPWLCPGGAFTEVTPQQGLHPYTFGKF